MKRSFGSTDSLGALMSICPTSEKQSPRNNHNMYSREFLTMLDGLDEEGCCIEESSGGGHVGGGEKKRRLSVDQVKALEKNFEVENKLEPERKVKLAQELGLQPRQVAVWFQNRRARWKTKQLERDYGVLKANYDSLKHNFDALQHDNEALLNEIRELKAKLDDEENTEMSNLSVKEEMETASEDVDLIEQTTPTTEISLLGAHSKDYINRSKNGGAHGCGEGGAEVSLCPDFKDGSSDSDSSAILTEDMNSPNAAMSSSSGGAGNILQNLITLNCFQFQKSSNNYNTSNQAQPQPFVKMEEHNFFSGEEACTFFSDEQAPTLPWYSDEHAQFCEWK